MVSANAWPHSTAILKEEEPSKKNTEKRIEAPSFKDEHVLGHGYGSSPAPGPMCLVQGILVE